MHILGMRNWVIIISVRFSEMQNWVIMIRGSAPLNECKLILSSEWLWASKQQYIKNNFSYNTPHTNKFTTVFRGGVFLWDCRGCLCWMVLFWICRQVGYFKLWKKSHKLTLSKGCHINHADYHYHHFPGSSQPHTNQSKEWMSLISNLNELMKG